MAGGSIPLTTRELKTLLDDANTQLVDVRPMDAYNGWRLQDEARGGHIIGARSLPAKWGAYLDWIEIVRSKGIVPDRPVVVYGYDDEDTSTVADLFRSAGYDDVRVYHAFVEEWAADPDRPMDRLPRHRHLVPAEWVDRLIRGEGAGGEGAGGAGGAGDSAGDRGGEGDGGLAEYDGKGFVVCHAHYRNPDDYHQGHIPGAVPLDTLLLESPETWNRRSPAEVRDALLALGITADTTVVLYGRFAFPDNDDPFPGSAAGQLAAFRCAFIMLWAGVRNVRILNGAMQAWLDAGYDVSTEPVTPTPAVEFGVEVPAAPELAVDVPEAKEIIASPDANLVSVRSWPEYIGEVSGYNYIEKKGRIPGSVFGNCGSDAYHMENYRNLDHTTREYGEVVEEWRSIGVTADTRNAFYCGTGWRGSEAFFNAWLMGWPRVALFDGGWFEWSNDDANPTETGEPGAAAA